MTTTTNQARRDEYNAWVNSTFLVHVCPVTERTRTYYGDIIGRLWEQHPTQTSKQKTERHLVVDLGIDINDVWITALAWEHGLTLVTHDGMEKLRPTVQKLGVNIEDWMQ
jgi:predicted nucleic acid-binding protein